MRHRSCLFPPFPHFSCLRMTHIHYPSMGSGSECASSFVPFCCGSERSHQHCQLQHRLRCHQRRQRRQHHQRHQRRQRHAINVVNAINIIKNSSLVNGFAALTNGIAALANGVISVINSVGPLAYSNSPHVLSPLARTDALSLSSSHPHA